MSDGTVTCGECGTKCVIPANLREELDDAASLRQALETSRAETREARELMERWRKHGHENWHDHTTTGLDIATRAFLAGRGGSPTERGTAAPQKCLNACTNVLSRQDWCGVCRSGEPEPSTGGEKP